MDMSDARKILPNYTYEDYLRWKGRWEIIEGIAYDMSLMTSPLHQKIAVNLSIILQNALDHFTCNCQVYQPIDVMIAENTILNPDLLIVCEDIEGQYYDKPPKLVVEIISPSSRLKDTITKYDLYRDFKVPYYLLIDPENKSTVLYLLVDNKYVEMDSPYILSIHSACEVSLDLSTLF